MSNLKLQVGRAKAVTPSDTDDIYFPGSEDNKVLPALLYVGLGGDLTVRTVGGDDVLFKAVPTGTFLPVNVIRVFSTDTSADRIVALW